MTFLEDNPPARSQFRTSRRAPSWHPSGPIVTAIVMHTSESVLDMFGTDGAAENVADFIANRIDAAGSYHSVVDSDSTVHLGRYEWEMFGARTGNRWALHLAFAMRAEDWPHDFDRDNPEHQWFASALIRAAVEANRMRQWAFDTHGVTIPIHRIITRDGYQRGVPGFIGHGDVDPDRRSDPGSRFPWDYFLGLVIYLSNGAPMPEPAVTEISTWQRDLVDFGVDLGESGPNGDGVDGDFGAITLAASRRVLAQIDTAESALADAETERDMLAAQLAGCEQDLAHDFTAQDAMLGRAARQWIRAMEADHPNEDDDG